MREAGGGGGGGGRERERERERLHANAHCVSDTYLLCPRHSTGGCMPTILEKFKLTTSLRFQSPAPFVSFPHIKLYIKQTVVMYVVYKHKQKQTISKHLYTSSLR